MTRLFTFLISKKEYFDSCEEIGTEINIAELHMDAPTYQELHVVIKKLKNNKGVDREISLLAKWYKPGRLHLWKA